MIITKQDSHPATSNTKKRTIWIIEDDENLQFVFKEILEFRYHLRFFSKIQEFLDATRKLEAHNKPEMSIVDLRLPDGNFLDYLAEYHSYGVPFMVASSIDDLDILRTCFKEGALDYLTKPFTKNEIIAKVERLLDRLDYEKNKHTGSIAELDPLHLQVSTSKGRTKLTVKEFRIVNCLLKSLGTPVSRQTLLEDIWGSQNVGEKTLDVHILNTRRKLMALELYIHFISNNGFVLSNRRDPKVILSHNILQRPSTPA